MSLIRVGDTVLITSGDNKGEKSIVKKILGKYHQNQKKVSILKKKIGKIRVILTSGNKVIKTDISNIEHELGRLYQKEGNRYVKGTNQVLEEENKWKKVN